MAFVLFLMFIFIPILEVSVIIQVGSVLGVMPTVALMILSAMIGASLVRSQGVATLMSVRQKMAQGQMPSTEIVEGLLLLVAGVLLVTPGFVTDIVGILILTAPLRKLVALALIKRFQFQVVNAAAPGGAYYAHSRPGFDSSAASANEPLNSTSTESSDRRGHVIDGEFERKD
ncbi:FxsA family protein [Corallincola luteus]|uniref:FxsA family protein n=1 Tax=Corallincola luteus TaxID=1775177 RepID=A0ABY2AMZ4_9GAMM|nr:FxsA family protein [Corallincola luteus]TCI04575.1 FxsA family protein [Corallincola luteus]